MKSFKIIWKKSASKELLDLPKSIIQRIVSEIEKLKEKPIPPNSKKLSTSEKTFRLRIGSYRVIYEVDNKQIIIHIIRVRHRKEAYRKL